MPIIRSRNACLRRLFPLLLFVLAATLSNIGNAQIARMEVLPFLSTTLTDQDFLVGRKDGNQVTVAGELRIPRAGNDKLPAVVLLHGSGGINSYVTDWEQDFLAMGVATFVVDSYSTRGIVSTLNDQSQLGRLAQTEDAYRALELLEKHPRIDPTRVMLVGFSRGGQAALYASMKRFQSMHGPASGREFAAYIAFYPSCNTAYRDDDNITAHPVRIFHGSSDDYSLITACRAYADRVAAKGKDIRLTEYPGAQHSFDGQAFKPSMKLPQAQTTRNCQLEEIENGRILNSRTKQTFTYRDPCVELGPTLAYNQEASMRARAAVKELVETVLKP
ncbi:dienelactone hydrolase family protein [Cupriavidus sp. CuC1]|uniref:dienelactone hydrolase family protein n=1 Tax=Cupriavidus sp. CuC1 TaxID=3373131 RepID=UPI0037D5A07D